MTRLHTAQLRSRPLTRMRRAQVLHTAWSHGPTEQKRTCSSAQMRHETSLTLPLLPPLLPLVLRLLLEGADIGEIFNSKIKAKLVDLETGEPTDKFDPLKFDQKKAAKDANLGVAIPSDKDIAGIKRRSKYAVVYEVLSPEGGLEQVVLPVHGKGLWSTMYGFLAINADSTTIQGIGYYQHGETPGLGGEVDNPRWKAIWKGKKLFNEQWDLTLEVIKGAVDSSRDDAKYKIDGLAGATLTTRGVDLMIKYWLGPEGFEKFLQSMRQGGGV